MKYFVLLASLLALSACELKGTMTVDSEFTAIDKKGRSYQIMPGTYRTRMDYDENDRELKLEIKDAVAHDDVELRLLVPVGRNAPERGKSFSYSARELGQSFSLRGQSTERFSQSEPLRRTETCHVVRYVRDCPYYPRGRRYCYNRPVNYIGYQTVEYRLNTMTESLELQLVSENGERTLARSSGQNSSTQEEIVYRGFCYL